MEDNRESSSFLGRAYKVAKLIAVATASVAGFVISLIALDVTKGHWWVDVKIPLYAAVFIIGSILVLAAFLAIVAVLVARDARSALSFYRNKSKGFEAKISTLRDLAFNDPNHGHSKFKQAQARHRGGRSRDLALPRASRPAEFWRDQQEV